jgi:hypothetical protein
MARVLMYATEVCPYCRRAEALLRRKGAERRRRDNISLLGRVFALILLGEVLSLVGNYY